MDNKPTSTAICLVKDNSQVLLQLRDGGYTQGANTWGFPGGGLEPNETIEQCGIREIFEETGYKTNKLTPLLVFATNATSDKYRSVQVFVDYYDNKQIINCYEGQKMEFVDIEKAKDLVKTSPLAEHFVKVLNELQIYLREVKTSGN